eukprot:4939469-Ditylum_brightwellii.AAC.1
MRNQKKRIKEKFGVKFPKNTREALLIDQANRDKKWGEAIAKEMNALERLRVFEYFDPGMTFSCDKGWQYAPMQMIFDVKHDLRRNAHFVVGGHVIDSTGHVTYSSTIKDLSVRLMLLIAVKHDLGFMAGGIGNAFCTAPCTEKIWSMKGDQFGNKKGSIVVLKRALYRLKTASASFHQFLGDFLREIGFVPLMADQDLGLQKLEEHAGYDYIATHIDNIIIVAKNPSKCMTRIEHHFQVRDVTDSPSYYLGNDLIKRGKLIHLSTYNYVKEVLRKYQEKYGSLAKENLPLKPKLKPELDDPPLVDEAKHKEYQHII